MNEIDKIALKGKMAGLIPVIEKYFPTTRRNGTPDEYLTEWKAELLEVLERAQELCI